MGYAIAAAAALSAAASIGGGLLSQSGGGGATKPDDMRTTGYTPSADPLVSALSIDALLGLGQGDIGIGQQASPIANVINAANLSGSLTAKDLRRVQQGLSAVQQGLPWQQVDPKQRAAVQRALAISGYGTINDLMAANQQYNDQQAKMEAAMAPIRQQVLQGRLAALGGISNVAQDYPIATQQSIDELVRQVTNQQLAQINRNTTDQRNQILEAANQGRFNPAQALGRVQEQSLLQQQAIPTTALDQALQLLSGKQTLANNTIAGYNAVLNPATLAGQQAANLRVGATANAAQLAASQNQAFQQLAQQNSQYNANALGSSVSNAGDIAGQTLLLKALLSKGPASTPTQTTQPTQTTWGTQPYNEGGYTYYG